MQGESQDPRQPLDIDARLVTFRKLKTSRRWRDKPGSPRILRHSPPKKEKFLHDISSVSKRKSIRMGQFIC